MFLTETWHQDDHHQARDASGQEINVGSTWYSGFTPMSTFRLKPDDYIDINGHGIGISAGEYQEERSTSSVGAWIEAKVGDEVHFTTTVRLDQQSWTRPDDPKDPVELRNGNIAERVALESPLPSSAADRRQLITRVTNEIFGDDPSDAEINDFLNDTSPDALLNLTARLQKRDHIPLFRGTLATGETIFKALPVDSAAATKPRRAIAPDVMCLRLRAACGAAGYECRAIRSAGSSHQQRKDSVPFAGPQSRIATRAVRNPFAGWFGELCDSVDS